MRLTIGAMAAWCILFGLLQNSMLQAAPKVQAGSVVNVPYITPDGKSPCWIIQQGGWIQQRRLNADDAIYTQTSMLAIEQNGVNQTNNQARVDEKTGEVILDNFQPINGLQLSRRVQVRRDDNVIRCVDVLKNISGADMTVGLQYTTSLNRGVSGGQTISDPKKPGSDFAWVAQTMRGRTAVDVFSGKGGQIAGQVQWEQGNNVCQYMISVQIPAGKFVAVMQLHAVVASADKGAELANSIRASKIVSDLPADVRKAIVNFPISRAYVGDREILRGTLFDVVELHGGDCLNGTLMEKSYKLQTLFGPMELPADKIVALLNVGQFRPRQLLVSNQGEMIGGTLDKQTISLQLASGQTTQIPLSQISRVGYRKRTNEPDEWTFDKPMVLLQSGDRMNIQLPDQPIEVMTRYGVFKLTAAAINSIQFQGEDHGVHEIVLNDGSRFAGLVSADQLTLKLDSAGMTIPIPVSSMASLQFSQNPPDIADDTATMNLSSGDMLVGPISGELKLTTAFDTIKIPGPQVRALTRVKESNTDVQITLWDQTKLTGQLEDPAVTCALSCGMSVKIPVALIDSYQQPAPLPSDQVMEKIKATVTQLGAEDWKARDQAQADLVAMGTTVLPVLKQLRDSQGPEAQQRIDTIVKQMEKPAGAAGPRGDQ